MGSGTCKSTLFQLTLLQIKVFLPFWDNEDFKISTRYICPKGKIR